MYLLGLLLGTLLWYTVIGLILLLAVSFFNISWIKAANDYCNDYSSSKGLDMSEKEFKLSFILSLLIVFAFLWPFIVPTLFHD